jgi:hypothetical protein
MAVVTRDSGTIHVKVDMSGNKIVERYGEDLLEMVNINAPTSLNEITNPTDWVALLNDRVANL